MSAALEAFHFIRPLILLAALPLAAAWWWMRTGRTAPARQNPAIATHLAAALEVNRSPKQRFSPIDGLFIVGVFLTFAAAGPTWNRLPNSLIDETAPLVIALKVSPSMETPDLAPTRLDRAKFKILDLIEARAGARTGLVAYAGSAHRVAPLTEDPNILRPLLEGLSPAVMPVDGDNAAAAATLATEILSTADNPGVILFVLDDLDPSNISRLTSDSNVAQAAIVFLIAAPDEIEIPQLGTISNSTIVRLTAGDADIAQIDRVVRAVHQAALATDETLQWNDRGWVLTWPIAVLVLFWFRRGWSARAALVLLAYGAAQSPTAAHADGWVDWFLTPDQQGRLAYQDKRFSDAGQLFEDATWRGYTKYRAGEYEDAIEVFTALDTADAAFAQGMAQIKSRQYRPAIQSFETALQRRPDFPEAARNLDIAIAITDFVERTREQSDTGEEAGIGADDVVFDNEAGRGANSQIEAPSEETAPLTTDQWIQSIDTNMGDFLRSRFLLENSLTGQ